MIYEDYEIFARVCGTYSDLYSLKDSGELDASQDIYIDNDDLQVVWYEVEMHDGEMFQTIEDAKEYIDQQIEEHRKEYGEEA